MERVPGIILPFAHGGRARWDGFGTAAARQVDQFSGLKKRSVRGRYHRSASSEYATR